MDDRITDTAFLTAILNTAVDAMVAFDEAGKILYVNLACGTLFGYRSEEVVGKNISTLIPEPDRSALDDYLQECIHTAAKAEIIGFAAITGFDRYILGRRKDGSSISLNLAVSEVKIGERTLFSGIMRNMTDRHQTKAELLSAQQKLIQSERLAAVCQMVTGLSHASRNALQRSRACLDMVSLDLEYMPEQQDLVKRSKSAILELQSIYEEVRDYAAPIKLRCSRYNIQSLCHEEWGNLTDQWRPLNVHLVLHDDSCPDVKCDKLLIGQVINNLFENSLSVAPENSQVRVACRVIDGPGKKEPVVQVRVSDDGPGFDPSHRSKVFDPFFTTKTKGTGLGMAICKRIIEAHDGQIFIEEETKSQAQTGASVQFVLPVG